MSETMKKIIFATGIGLAVGLFFLITGNSVKQPDVNKNIHATVEPMQKTENVGNDNALLHAVVDVKGEVNKPGVYEIRLDSRVNDVIELAGGFTEEADIHLINLAQKVHDEMAIIVMSKSEEGQAPTGATNGSQTTGKVRMNYATQEEIETLNGIGPAKAQAIIQYREEHGLFSSPEDLLNISGIGEKTLQNFVDQIQIP